MKSKNSLILFKIAALTFHSRHPAAKSAGSSGLPIPGPRGLRRGVTAISLDGGSSLYVDDRKFGENLLHVGD